MTHAIFRTSVIVAVTLTSLAASPRSADAQFCPLSEPLWDVANSPVDVYLNTNVVSFMCQGSATCTSFLDVERTTRATIAEFNNTTASALRLNYAGSTSTPIAGSPTYHASSNTIHVYAQNCTSSAGAVTFLNGSGMPNTTKAAIQVCGQNSGGQIAWDSMGFQHALIHELGHAVGMDHPDQCHINDMSMVRNMPVFVDRTGHPHKYDIDFMQFYYGYRNKTARPEFSSDAVTWFPSAWSGPLYSTYALSRFAASNSLSGQPTYVTYGDDQFRWVYATRYGPSSWTYQSAVPLAVSHFHSGVASSSDSDLEVAWLGAYVATTGFQKVYASQSATSGLSWTGPTEVSDAFSETKSSGVSSTYDPVTNRYIRAWRVEANTSSTMHEIAYSVEGFPGVDVVRSYIGTTMRAADTPSIACGEDIGLSTNCILAWVDGDHWQRPVRWIQFSMHPSNTSMINVSSIQTHPYLSFGSASVAFRDSGTYPWMIHLSQGGNTTYTWRKRQSAVYAFQDQSNYTYLSPNLPAAGSRLLGSGASRSYGFVPE